METIWKHNNRASELNSQSSIGGSSFSSNLLSIPPSAVPPVQQSGHRIVFIYNGLKLASSFTRREYLPKQIFSETIPPAPFF